MLDEMDRVYFVHKILQAEERIRLSRDERQARPFRALLAEYRQKLNEIPERLSDAA